MTVSTPPHRRALLRVAEENVLLVVLVCFTAALLLTVLAPYLFVADSWMTLAAGRELAEHGLPTTDTLTVFGRGRTWTDQQWLAQLALYGAEWLGGLRLVSVAGIALVVASLSLGIGAARGRGGSARATLLVAIPVVFAAPWSWQVRAQSFSLAFFAAALWLLVDARERIGRRTLWLLPLLVVWANVHGTVALGAMLATLLAGLDLVRRRRAALPVAPLLAAGSWLALLVTPYGPGAMIDYYRLLLLDPPFGDLIVEWQRTKVEWTTLAFLVLAATAAVLVVWQRRRLSSFEIAALGLTLASAVEAVRGITWFALACLVILPVALDGALRLPDPPIRRGANRVVAGVAVGAVAASLAVLLVRGDRWLEGQWPEGGVAAVARATQDPSVRVFGTDRHADWLLWRLPQLRGRIAFDVRFELYARGQIEDIVRYNGELGADWLAVTAGYGVVVLDGKDEPSHVADLEREPGSRVVYADDAIAVVTRP